MTLRTSATPGLPMLCPRIRCRDVEHIRPGYLQDVVQVSDCLDILDHGDNQHLGIDPRSRFVARDTDAIVLGASATHAPVAVRVVAGSAGDGGGLLASIDVGHDDPLQAPVEVSQDGRLRVVRDPRDGGDSEGLAGPNHVLHLVKVGGPRAHSRS